MIGFIAVVAVAVSSQVTDVTVYSDRAQVTRTADVQLESGINKLIFEDLPEAVDSRGIQVDGSGSAVVLDVRLKTENFKDIPKDTWKELCEEQERLQEEEQAIIHKIARLNSTKAFLQEISAKVTHTAEKEDGGTSLDPGSWESMLALYTTKNQEYDEQLRSAEKELKVLRQGLKKVQADIRDAGVDTRKKRRVVEVDLESPAAGKAVLKLSYRVRGPEWVPTYDVRVNTDSREMEVNYFALVRQNTGEDWGDVALKLSTANPGLGGRHPELKPWRIKMKNPQGAKSLQSWSAADVEEYAVSYNAYEPKLSNLYGDPLLGDAPLSSAAPVPQMKHRQVEAVRQGASVVFEVKGRSGIASDNVEHRVAVSSIKLPSIFRYSTIPKINPYAFLKAKAKNGGAHPFLEGRANIFLDGSFVTTSSMELVAPEEEFWVFLGADESIKVEHKLVKKYQSKEGITGRGVRHTYEYLMTIKNTHAVPEEVIVWDQFPISGTEGLKVKLQEPKYSKDTDSLKIDDEQRISWFRIVDAGEEWEIPFSFHVEAPKGMNIDGL